MIVISFGRNKFTDVIVFRFQELPDGGQMPALSVLKQQLLPRSPSSAFAPTMSGLSAGLTTIPAPRRRRTSSGLPESPPGSSSDRSSMAASPSPDLPPSLDMLVGSVGALGTLGPLGHFGPQHHAALPATSPIPQQVSIPPDTY